MKNIYGYRVIGFLDSWPSNYSYYPQKEQGKPVGFFVKSPDPFFLEPFPGFSPGLIYYTTIGWGSEEDCFREKEEIIYSLPEKGIVSIFIFTYEGRLIHKLLENVILPKGTYNNYWDGKNILGEKFPTGEYIGTIYYKPLNNLNTSYLLKEVPIWIGWKKEETPYNLIITNANEIIRKIDEKRYEKRHPRNVPYFNIEP